MRLTPCRSGSGHCLSRHHVSKVRCRPRQTPQLRRIISVMRYCRLRNKNSPGQRPEACLILCLSCFKSISLIIVRSQGPRWAKLGVSDTPWIPLGYRCGRKIAPKSSCGALGALLASYLPATATKRDLRVAKEAPGVDFGSQFGSKINHF